MRTSTTMRISKWSQPNQFPTRSATQLQLEYHQCVSLLKAVYGLVNAPRRWSQRVVTDLRNMGGEESLMELCLWTFRDGNGVIQALCFVHVDDFMLACSDSPFGTRIFGGINNPYEWRTWESRVFTQCGARTTQAYDKHTKTWSGFEISFTEYVKEISLNSLPSHRRRDRKSPITPPELSLLRASSSQSLGLGMQCLPQLLAPHSLLMGQTPQAKVETIYEVNKLARTAIVWTNHSKSTLIFLLWWSRAQMLGGPLAQTELRMEGNWSSSQTPSCCKAKNQTCL